jgi:hypothetical protein
MPLPKYPSKLNLCSLYIDQFELKMKYKVNTDSVLMSILEGASPNIFGIVKNSS